MIAPPAIARFTEDELERAPKLFDDVLSALVVRLTRPNSDDPAEERVRGSELAQALVALRHRMVADFSSSLAIRARRELERAPSETPAAAQPFSPASLSLVDETAVVADVETSRAAATIKSVTEHEFRELTAFLSALAGDALVCVHHMALHPDQQARALWDAAKLLPDEKELRPRFMRQVAPPLGAALRIQWASACSRLEDAGIVPAAYRTVILNAGMRIDAGVPAGPPPTFDGVARALELIGRRLSAPDGTAPVGAARANSLAGARRTRPDPGEDLAHHDSRVHRADSHRGHRADASHSVVSAASAVVTVEREPGHGRSVPVPLPPDPRLATLGRIFDTFSHDARIDPDLRPTIERLREPALQSAAGDTLLGLVDQHPLWSLIDRIAWQGRTLPAPPHRERVRTAQVVKGLADQLAKEPQPSAARFQWALDRVAALEVNRLERRAARHAPQIAALDALDRDLACGPGDVADATRRSDFGQLPTVPANLYDSTPAPSTALAPADAWLDSLTPSSVARLLIQGRWVLAQLLWHSDSGELWLWGECTSDELWPIRRGALCMLFQGGLAGSAQPDGVVREIVKDAGVRAVLDTVH